MYWNLISKLISDHIIFQRSMQVKILRKMVLKLPLPLYYLRKPITEHIRMLPSWYQIKNTKLLPVNEFLK